MSSEPGRGGNYLAIDGGVNPLSALYIIDEMFQRLKFDLGSEEDIRPCDWFDLIVGSGHGGLIALLLGRLQMKTPQAIEAYNSLASVLATEPTEVEEEREDNKARFMDAFRSIKPNSVDALMRTSAKENSSCKVAICALNAINRSSCQLIRSYVSRGMNAPQGTILQAACATIASPDAYNPVVIGKGGDVMSYIDAMAGYANPTNEMLTEAEKVFGKNGLVATIISIGSGKLDVIRQQESVNDILRRTLSNTEPVHNNLQSRFGELGIYYRFSVENVISRNNREVTRAQTIAYLEEETNNQRMDGAVNSIHERKGLKPIKELNSISKAEVQYRQRPEVVSFFVGRQDILDRLHETHVRSPKPEGEYPTISVLTGLGGSGKTQIALQFAKEFQAINSKLLVFFVDASSEDQIKEDYQAIIRSRGIAHRTSTYEHALQWFASMDDPWLIIADNADEPKLDLHPFVPRCSRSHFIITSRNINQGLMARRRAYRVQELATDDSVKLLLDVSGYDSNNTNAEYATAIVRTLGYLPLAIVQAAGYIYKHKCLSSYLRLFNESREKLLAQKANELPHDYNLSVATTLEISFNRLPLPSRQALCILSFLHNTSIPHQIIETASSNKFYYASGKASDADREKLDEIKAESDALCRIFCPQEKWSEAEFNEIVEPCFQYSLLQSTISVNDQKFYSMHILVQSWLQTQSIPHKHHSSRLLARRMLLSVAQEGSQYQYFELHQMLLPHLRAFAGQPSDTLTAMTYLAEDYINLGEYNAAQKLDEETLVLRGRVLGTEHPDTLTSMGNLARDYSYLGEHRKSQEVNKATSILCKKILGPEHPDTLRSMNSLAVDHSNLGEYKKARELHEEILALQTKVLGPEHPVTLQSMNNLAAGHSKLGEHKKARELNEATLALRTKVLGPEHPDTLQSMGNLATDHTSLGEHREAQELNEAILALRTKVLGPEHPDTLNSMHNLASDHRDLGEYERARELYETTLALRTKVLGSEHLDTLQSMSSLATIHNKSGEHKKAQELDEAALALRTKVLGSEHPDTLLLTDNLAVDHSNLGEHKKARELNEATLALRRKLLGTDHPATLDSMSRLACNYRSLGMYEKAQQVK
ncbi:TPR-like protein [Serendipita vermifera]|nr:TPR-like protein [Serendipita vermifera]